jgi:hypothetical protein
MTFSFNRTAGRLWADRLIIPEFFVVWLNVRWPFLILSILHRGAETFSLRATYPEA